MNTDDLPKYSGGKLGAVHTARFTVAVSMFLFGDFSRCCAPCFGSSQHFAIPKNLQQLTPEFEKGEGCVTMTTDDSGHYNTCTLVTKS